MKRYFYTDPLAASWMAKHFGMRIELPFHDRDWFSGWVSIISELEDCHYINPERARDKYYIHPSSEHLLKPQDGDQGASAANGMQCHYWKVGWFYNGTQIDEYPQEPIQIDKRDGTAFIWPETEEA